MLGSAPDKGEAHPELNGEDKDANKALDGQKKKDNEDYPNIYVRATMD